MTWEDVDLAINTTMVPHNISVSNVGVTPLLPPDPRRIAVVISAPVTNNLFVHFGDGAVNGQGIRISTSQTSQTFDMENHGEMPRRQVSASISVAAENIEFYEILCLNMRPGRERA